MKKVFLAGIGLAIALNGTQAQAAQSVDEFIYDDAPASGYFHCAYKMQIATDKCLVTLTEVKSSIDNRAKSIFGSNEKLELLTIKWPDGDIGRYVDIGGDEVYKLINLGDNKSYNYKTDDDDGVSLNFDKGLIIIDSSRKEHIRLW